MEYNKQQTSFIESLEGAFLISAPVGTGKTTVLAERVVRALESGYKPEEIVCLTFTNRAAEEMSSRIRAKVTDPDVFRKLTIKTFHGFCAYFVKAESKHLGLPRDFVVIDDEEQREILERILSKHPSIKIAEGREKKWQLAALAEDIYKLDLARLLERAGVDGKMKHPTDQLIKMATEYKQVLSGMYALDFNMLVTQTFEALYFNKDIQKKWQTQVRLLMLDEFQDTHLSEYLVVKHLAREHKNIAFIGDIDQTIYSWRGSEPERIVTIYKKHFDPVTEISFSINYRSDPSLVSSFKSVLESFENAQTQKLESSDKGRDHDETAIEIAENYNFAEECAEVASVVQKLRKDQPEASIAVLARAHYLIGQIADVFKEKGIEHITVDKYDFFKRQEIRDMYAYMKLLTNRYDLESAYRAIARPPRNIGDTTLADIRKEGDSVGLKVSDFLTFANFNYPEPFTPLIEQFSSGRLIVLDTETTGTDTYRDDIIQIYATEIVAGEQQEEFHHYMQTGKVVGTSEQVHGISDAFLKEKGEDPTEILTALKEFIGDSPVVGHNVSFDRTMIEQHSARLGVDTEINEYYDTLDIAKRFVDAPNYRLGTLAELFSLEVATHSADDDVAATVGLLEVLVDKLKKDSAKREVLFKKYSKKFIVLAQNIADWHKKTATMRPAEFAQYLWEASGLEEYYAKDKDAPRRQESIQTLIQFFSAKDDPEQRPQESLSNLINFASLAKNLDFLGLDEGKVPVVTVHQVKGLEFDYVFLLGCNEYTFPSSMAIKEDSIEEERRLFYVALTRARKKAFCSYSLHNRFDRPTAKSRFLSAL